MVEVYAYSKSKQGNLQLSRNFKVKEFACKDGSDVVFIAPKLVVILQSIRDYFNKPVNINSAYRTPTHNKKVGGVKYSQHTYGMAADIVVKGENPEDVAAVARKFLGNNKGGVGIYSTFTHVDVRETPTNFDYR